VARPPKIKQPPLNVGDTVKVYGNPAALITIRKVWYVGKKHSQTGWLADAWDGQGKYTYMAHDVAWFKKV
jgi:hypothetical protein